MNLEHYIANRYLFSRQRGGLLSLITIISVGGVAVGVTALIIVISVLDGFGRDMREKLLGAFSHVEIKSPIDVMDNYDELVERLGKHPMIEIAEDGEPAVAPLIQKQAMLQRGTGIESPKHGVLFFGIDPKRESRVTNLQRQILTQIPMDEFEPQQRVFANGNIQIYYTHPSRPGKEYSTIEAQLYSNPGAFPEGKLDVMMGIELAKRLEVVVGQDVYTITQIVKTANGPWPKIAKLRVCGVFESGLYELDSNCAYVTLDTAQRIFLLDDVADNIHIRLKDPNKSDEFRMTLVEDFRSEEPQYLTQDRQYMVLGLQDKHGDLFAALALEKLGMYIVLTLIVLVASFNIIGTLILIVMEKTRDIGILRSLGCGSGHVLRIFLLQGLMIGGAGIALGMALGLGGCWFIKYHLPFQLPEAIYGIERIPVRIEWFSVLTIMGVAFLVTVLASIIPSVQACRIKPIEALRYE